MSGVRLPVLSPRACDRCGRCLAACPHDALRVGRAYLRVDAARCDGCGACAKACPRGAIMMPGGARGRVTGATRERAASGRAASARPGDTPRARSAAARPAPKASPARGGDRSSLAARLAGGSPKGGSRGGFQWTVLEAVAMLSVTFSAFVVKEAVTVSASLAALPPVWQTPARVAVLALYYAVQVAVLVWLVRRRGGEPAEALGLRVTTTGIARVASSAGLVVGGLVVTRLVASLYVLLTRSAGLLPTERVDLVALFGLDAAGIVLAVVMVVLVGPLVEEVVFRGALLEGLAARFGTWPAIAAQAAVFAALHRSVWLLFPTFVLGVVLGWLAHERQSLWPPVAMHALYNALTVAAALLAGTASGA